VQVQHLGAYTGPVRVKFGPKHGCIPIMACSPTPSRLGGIFSSTVTAQCTFFVAFKVLRGPEPSCMIEAKHLFRRGPLCDQLLGRVKVDCVLSAQPDCVLQVPGYYGKTPGYGRQEEQASQVHMHACCCCCHHDRSSRSSCHIGSWQQQPVVNQTDNSTKQHCKAVRFSQYMSFLPVPLMCMHELCIIVQAAAACTAAAAWCKTSSTPGGQAIC
jgi:hypothetical protein